MKIISRDEYFMGIALKEADKAAALGEVPVGAVVVWKNKIVSQAFNTRETDKNALCHAEIKAIDEACRKLGGWRLFMCELHARTVSDVRRRNNKFKNKARRVRSAR